VHDCCMKTGWVIFGIVILGACGKANGAPLALEQPVAGDPGPAAVPDAGLPRAGAAAESVTPAAGSGGAGASSVLITAAGSGAGGMEVGGVGGLPSAGAAAGSSGQSAAGSGGTGGIPIAATGGTAAPADRVLWSQSWTVALHDEYSGGNFPHATMGLFLDAGDLCRFGLTGAPSGSSQTFPTDGTCITPLAQQHLASGSAIVCDSNGVNGPGGGGGGSAALVGWVEAVSGHTVKYLRRTQTYTIQLLGSGSTAFNYADFQGTWEAIGN
jgi:hypothetical protein